MVHSLRPSDRALLPKLRPHTRAVSSAVIALGTRLSDKKQGLGTHVIREGTKAIANASKHAAKVATNVSNAVRSKLVPSKKV